MTDNASSKLIGAALILSEDKVATGQLAEAMQELALSVVVCIEIGEALDRVNHSKLEVGIIDFSLGKQATHFLQRVRGSAPNRTAVTFAITSGSEETASALKAGSSFALERPLTMESVRQTLNAAYGLIVRERRRYFRCPISVPAGAKREGESEVFGRTLNISEHGMAWIPSTGMEPGTELTIQFTLPVPHLEVHADCRVRWNNENGRAGLSFLHLPSKLAAELQTWLALKLEEQLPELVAQRFQSSAL